MVFACGKADIDGLEALVGEWNASPTCADQRIAFDLAVSRIEGSSQKLKCDIVINRRQRIDMEAVVINDDEFELDSLFMNGRVYYGQGVLINSKLDLEFNTIPKDSTVVFECDMSLCKLN